MIDVDIGRVVFVNANKYTIDLISINGNQYQDIPFLSLYSKPDSSGQGMYMMPERDSYALILKIKNKFIGAERFCIGFFNPMGDDGRYDGDREEINQGDFVAKTVFGNKIIGRTDGSITVKASEQSQFTMFPSSGNKEDSWGYDNLLRAIFENVEINTDAGHIHQKVNKKDETTNINFEIRNKPLYSGNPQVIRGNIGSQGTMGDSQYFKTLEVVDKINEGRDEVIRQKLEWKTNGYKHHIINDAEGNPLQELTIDDTFNKNVKKFNSDGSGNLIYQMDLAPNGTKTTTTYDGSSSQFKKSEYIIRDDGYFKKTIWNEPGQNDCYIYEIDALGKTKEVVKNNSGQQVLLKTTDNTGLVELNLGTAGNVQLSMNGVTGNITLTMDNKMDLTVKGDLAATVLGDATISASNATVEATNDATVKGTNATVEATSTADIKGANVNVTATNQVNLGGLAGAGVARVGDTVQVSPSTGTGSITTGSTKVNASL